jgi:NTP pyrophosphatase (non-canonical NTP hydrolase)
MHKGNDMSIEKYTRLMDAAKALSNTPVVDDDFPLVKNELDSAILAFTRPSLKRIAEMQYEWVESVGWHNKTVLEALALIASEVGEAVNECRGEKPSPKFGEELADIILRTLDLAEWQGIDISEEVSKKMAMNLSRGTRGRLI